MKTVILFSSIFYLLGMKIGNTIEILKRVIVPVKTIISAPAEKHEQAGKNYYYSPEKTTSPKKEVNKENGKAAPVSETAKSVKPDQKSPHPQSR